MEAESSFINKGLQRRRLAPPPPHPQDGRHLNASTVPFRREGRQTLLRAETTPTLSPSPKVPPQPLRGGSGEDAGEGAPFSLPLGQGGA